ncbi:hypothetical protein ACQY0O_004314 [Thecaphora frezii]|nr:YSC84-like protein [Thecaphora frezii]
MGNPLPVNLSQECRKATQILNDFVDPVNGLDRVLPLSVLRKAKGFAIFSVFRIGFVLSARAGSGIVIVKTEQGQWSAPAAIGIGGLGGGFNVGAEVTDFLIVLNSRSAVRSFMATGSLQLGGNLSLAVGPLGRSAEASGSVNSSGKLAAMFSYSRSKGLYGGVSVEGTILIDREDANGKAYGRGGHTAKQILSGSVEVPSFAKALISTIERFTLAHTPVADLDNPYDEDDDFFSTNRGRDDDSDFIDSRDRQPAAADTSWNERREQYQNGGSTRRETVPELEDDFGRLGLSNSPRRSSESWTEAEKRRRNDAEIRNMGAYAFGSPASSMTNAPPRTGSGASVRKRPGIRQRSSSIASNLSFGSFGRKKNGSTPIQDLDTGHQEVQDRLDSLDRELQSGNLASKGGRLSHSARISSYGGPSSYSNELAGNPFHRHRTNSCLSVTSRNGWSTFGPDDGHGDDDLFGSGTSSSSTAAAGKNGTNSSDPFANLTAGLENKWTSTGVQQLQPRWDGGYSGSTMRGISTLGATNVPQPIASPASSVEGRTRSYSSQRVSRDTSIIHETRVTTTFGNLLGDDFDTPSSGGGGSGSNGNGTSGIADPPILERAVALYDFEAQEEGDLGFTKGQVIQVTKKTKTRDDWWQGRVQNGASTSRIGIFPASYTQPL